MSSKHALFVDDHRPSVQPFAEMLERSGYAVDYRDSPIEGIQAASHQYAVMFVDYHFDNARETNGAGVARKVRREYPLLPLILMTDRGKERETWRDSVSAGFDSYFPKEVAGERPPKTLARLKEAIRDAQASIAERYQLEFSEQECGEMIRRLDALENAYRINAGKNGQIQNLDEVTQVAAFLLKSGQATLTSEQQREIILIRARDSESLKAAAKIKADRGVVSTNSWAMYFKLHDKAGHLDRNALKARHLLIRHPERWPLVCEKYPQVKKLVSYFCLSIPRSAEVADFASRLAARPSQ